MAAAIFGAIIKSAASSRRCGGAESAQSQIQHRAKLHSNTQFWTFYGFMFSSHLTFIVVEPVLAVCLLPMLAVLPAPALAAAALPVPARPGGAALALAPAPRRAALQRAVPAIPALLTDAGAVGALAVSGAGLAAGPAGAPRPGPAWPADTPPALALAARPAVQPAHLQCSHFI